MILIRWKGVEAEIGLDGDRRWTGPPDLVEQLDATFGPDTYATADEQLAAACARLGGTPATTTVPAPAPAPAPIITTDPAPAPVTEAPADGSA